MCLIIGYFNFKNSTQKTINSMQKLSYRGKDSSGIYNGKNIIIKNNINELKNIKETNFCIGHNLLSIVNFSPQPIKEKGILITNCEIYNYKKLNKKYNLNSNSDSQTLLKLLDKKGIDILDKLDGPFAFAYLKDNILILSRDILGIKPLFYYKDNNKFAFASEKKVLPKNSIELKPNQILYYNIKTNQISFKKKEFYKLTNEHKENYEKQKEKTKKLLINSIKKRIPKNQKIGLLFSGGIDSTFIAIVLKQLGVDFTCYTAKVEGGKIKEASDLIYAKKIAKEYDLDLKIATTTTQELEKHVIDVVKIIEDRDYIKVSVALPFYLACKKAKEDNVKVMFSGLGSEEIFAGYNRHKKVNDINNECLEGLKILHIRDLYRDDVITMKNEQELRVPFLDKKLIEYSLNIPDKYKLSNDKIDSKLILRDIAKDLGIKEEYSMRQKKAAQYGSKFDKGLLRLAKNYGSSKEDYMNSLEIGNIDKVYYNSNNNNNNNN